MKPSAIDCRNRSPWEYVARAWSYREKGDARPTTVAVPLNNFTLTSPVTRSWDDDRRRGTLVHLAGLDADDARFDVVDPSDPVAARQLAQSGDQINEVHGFSLKGGRFTAFEADRHIAGLVRCRRGACRPCVDLLRRLDPRVLEDSALNRSAPQVFVRTVRRTVVDGDRDPPLLRVPDLLLPGHP